MRTRTAAVLVLGLLATAMGRPQNGSVRGLRLSFGTLG